MAESRSHKKSKYRFAGPGGRTEVRLPSGKRLDALSKRGIAGEVERQGPRGIRKAVSRLAEAKRTGEAKGVKIAVPDWHMPAAMKEMHRQGISGRVENLSNTRSNYARPTRKYRKRR